MKFILISRHTGGREIPENEKAQNLKDLGEWIVLLKAEIAMPNLNQAVMLAQKSPGLKYGWTHDVFPEISMGSAASK